ncbi:hypothetical protein HMPREF1137_1908 [Actinomyces sp. ICM39]|nr:hypothetical protein HMPREF1137_1908 [Actinomyces sp. ICM39]
MGGVLPEERFACHVSSAARSVFAILPGRARQAACSAGHGALSRTVRASSSTRPGRVSPGTFVFAAGRSSAPGPRRRIGLLPSRFSLKEATHG